MTEYQHEDIKMNITFQVDDILTKFPCIHFKQFFIVFKQLSFSFKKIDIVEEVVSGEDIF